MALASSKPFDATTKELVEAGPLDWLHLLGFAATAAHVIDADLATVTTDADRVILSDAPTRFLTNIEFETGKHGNLMPGRLFHYNVLLGHRHNLPVQSVVLLLRKVADSPALSGTLTRALPNGTVYHRFDYRVLHVWDLDTETLLSGGLSTLPLAPLTVGRNEVADVVRIVEERVRQEADRTGSASCSCPRIFCWV